MDDDQYECFIHAYLLAKNMRFKHSLSIRRIFGKGEYPSMISTTPSFLHLQDHDFFPSLAVLCDSSCFSLYLSCFSLYLLCQLEISPKDNGLSISILSIQKYSPDEDIDFLYCAKIQNKESKETVRQRKERKTTLFHLKKRKLKLDKCFDMNHMIR